MSLGRLERVVLDGKPGTLAYFDAQGRMTTVDRAVTAKVVFDDGSRLWLTLTQGSKP